MAQDNRRVVTIILDDGTEVRRLVPVMAPDRRRPDWVNRLHRGEIQGRNCPSCTVFHRGACND